MKNQTKIIALAALTAIGFSSCTDADNTVDEVFDGVTSGAILRTIGIESNEIPIDDATATFEVEIEAQDNQDGALLSSVDVFISYADGSPDDGDSSGATSGEVFFKNITAEEFSDGPFGLPRYTLVITAPEFLEAMGLEFENTFGGDSFTTRLALKLTDGREFSVNNAGGIITGGFFSSPFQYITPVVCPVGEDEFVGNYTITNIIPSDFGNIYGEGTTVALIGGDTSVDRSFEAVVLPDLEVGQPAAVFAFQMVCGQVIVSPGQPTSLQCGGSLLLGPPINSDPGTYTTGDDSTFNIVIGYNESGDATCAESLDVEIQLSKL